MAKMYGKLGWYGQCKCCDGNADKRTTRARETRQWHDEYMLGYDEREEYEDYLNKMCPCHKHLNLPDDDYTEDDVASYQEHAAARRAAWSPEVQEFANQADAYFKNECEKLRAKMAEPLPEGTRDK